MIAEVEISFCDFAELFYTLLFLKKMHRIIINIAYFYRNIVKKMI